MDRARAVSIVLALVGCNAPFGMETAHEGRPCESAADCEPTGDPCRPNLCDLGYCYETMLADGAMIRSSACAGECRSGEPSYTRSLFPECGVCDDDVPAQEDAAECLDGSGMCGADGLCPSAEGCANGQHDSGETDVDCGGACPPCGAYQACDAPADCLSGSCGTSWYWCGGGSCCAETHAGHPDDG